MSRPLLVVAVCLVCAFGCRSERVPHRAAPTLMLEAAPSQAAPITLTASEGTGLILRELRARVVIEAGLACTSAC